MKARFPLLPVRLALFVTLVFCAANAQAFAPYIGKKFKDARFTATGEDVITGEHRAVGEVDFKFKGSNPDAIEVDFKGKLEADGKSKRFKGSLDFKADGSVEIDGLPGQGNEKISGRYTITGTTVNFEGEKKVTIKGVEVKVKIEGSMSIDANGDVRIKGTVDAGGGLAKGKFDMNSAKDPPKEKNRPRGVYPPR